MKPIQNDHLAEKAQIWLITAKANLHTWEAVARHFGLPSRAAAYLIAQGKRPVHPALRRALIYPSGRPRPTTDLYQQMRAARREKNVVK